MLQNQSSLFSVPSCGGVLTSPGTITTPGYPGNYSNNEDCEWVIQFRPQMRIKLEFHDFEIQHHGECRYRDISLLKPLY